MSANTVYLTREDVGLVHWDDYTRKPPYSEQDYHDAYNNGLNMVAAFMAANEAGASKVVLERGNYPFCYGSSGGGATSINSHTNIVGTSKLEIDGNSSLIFVIFDSEVANPYQTNTTILPYMLPGNVFRIRDNTNLSIHGFELRGDQYNRKWVTGEKTTEQTYGIYFDRNNINTTIDIIGHGFRGDAISGNSKSNESYISLYEDWSKGGISVTTGLPTVETGAYKSPKVDLRGKTVFRNAIQIVSAGFIKSAEFREDRFNVFFYDDTDTFISYDSSYQTEFIYLPVNCRYVQLVAYGDERTTDVVDYGRTLWISSGSSEYCTIKGEFFANHRGAISNLCGYTTIDANIHDNGTLKYGFPHYDDPTRYGVNFEDLYVNKLTIKGKIKNGVQGVLFNGRILDVQDCEIRDIQINAVGVYSSVEANISNSVMENIGNLAFEYLPLVDKKRATKVFNISDCTFKKVRLNGNYNSVHDAILNIKDNTFISSDINLLGNGKNLVFDNNTLLGTNRDGWTTAAVHGALRVTNNTFKINKSKLITSWQAVGVGGIHSNDNTIISDVSDTRIQGFLRTPTTAEPLVVNGMTLRNTGITNLPSIQQAADNLLPQEVRIDDCNFILGDKITIGNIFERARFCDLDFIAKNSAFEWSSATNTITSLFDVSIRETEATGVHNIVFDGCELDISNCKYLINVSYAIKGKLNIKFINCTFKATTPKKIPFIRSLVGLANVTATAIGCKFVNVVNGK